MQIPGVAAGKSYTISRAALEATLLPDGSLAVTETRTYQFDGAFSHIYQLIRLPQRSVLEHLDLADEQVPKEWDLPHRFHMYGLAVLGVVVALLTYPSPLRTLTWIASALLLVVGFAQRSLTDEGYRQREGWGAVRREWEKGFDLPYLPEAVALGLNVVDAFDTMEELNDLLWIGDAFTAMDGYWGQPASSGSSDGSSGGGGGGGAE